jgi:hypothetical protein
MRLGGNADRLKLLEKIDDELRAARLSPGTDHSSQGQADQDPNDR